MRPLSPIRPKVAKPGATDPDITLTLNDGEVYRRDLRTSAWRLTQVSKPAPRGPAPPVPAGPFKPLPPPVF